MSRTADIQALERENEGSKKLVELKNLAEKLSGNRDFRKLIHDEYFVQEPARLVGLSGDPVLSKEQKEDALAMAQAPGHLKRWLHVTMQMGYKAEEDMKQRGENLEELRGMSDEDYNAQYGDEE